jgi:flagellar biogenesis protein FliO
MTIGYYIQTLLSFSLIVLLLWGSLKYVKKLQIKRLANEMAILDRLPVSKNASILIVQIRSYDYILAVSENEVKILDKLDKGHVNQSYTPLEDNG